MLIGDFYFEIPKEFPSLTVTSVYFVVFCIITFALSRPFKSILRPYILLIANCVFLWSFSKDYYFIILITICSLFSYLFGLLLDKYKNKILLFFGVGIFALLLIYYKYFGLISSKELIIPLGLSFYSFKIISYLVDIYQEKISAEKNIIYYFDYVMFFPCITAGPINRSKDFISELRNPQEFDYKDSKSGGFQLVLGIFEKMVFCDYIAQIVPKIFEVNEIVGLNVLLGIFLYAFQIYLDFDAASNIAIGSARLLGFHLPKNFNSPYLSKNLKEFWSRWHISLSTWFKDYIYIPLGGNKKGNIRKYINLVMVFIISGLWHGSTINFLIWGLLHGLIRILEDIVESNIKFITNKNIFISIIRIVSNFIIVSFLWLPFKYQSFGEVLGILRRLFIVAPINFETIGLTINETYWLIIVIGIVIIVDILRNNWDMLLVFNKVWIPFRWITYALLIVTFLIFGVYGGSFEVSDFIYRFF